MPQVKMKERSTVAIGQMARVSLPYPSQWDIYSSIGGRPTTLGTLLIYSVMNNTFSGAVNFRGSLLSIQGYWNESTRQIAFDSPYASFSGNLTFFDEPQINMRHYLLKGTVRMKPPSIRAGESGTWTATTEMRLR